MSEERFVTCDYCEEHRELFCEELTKQRIQVSNMGTKVDIFEKVMYAILVVLIGGFTGTIFAVLQAGG